MKPSHPCRGSAVSRCVPSRAALAVLVLLLPGVAGGSIGAPRVDFAGVSADRPTGSPGIAAAGLVVAFDMESTTDDGRLRDFGDHGIHGSVTVTTLIDGLYGRARRFTEVADRVALEADPRFDLDGPHTIAAWVRIDEVGLHQHIFALRRQVGAVGDAGQPLPAG